MPIGRCKVSVEASSVLKLNANVEQGGDLFDAITQNVKFPEWKACTFVTDLCTSLFYLHSRIIVHRDLKPENLLVYSNFLLHYFAWVHSRFSRLDSCFISQRNCIRAGSGPGLPAGRAGPGRAGPGRFLRKNIRAGPGRADFLEFNL